LDGIDPEHAREELERLAGQTPYLDLGSVVYHRTDRGEERANPTEEAAFQRVLAELRSPRFSKDALIGNLDHPMPTVRSLVAVALFMREDPSVLPLLVPLTQDDAPTFESAGQPRPSFVLGPREAQTVGAIAERLVNVYLNQAGFHYGISGHSGQPGFRDYWAARSTRSYCASWFAVQLLRAGQGTIPTPSSRIGEIRKLRERIDQVPGDDRVWTLLWLRQEPGADELVSESELVELCKILGPEKLVRVLQRKIPSTDPDLQPRNNNNGRYGGMCLFILQHAAELLRTEDAEALERCEQWEQDYRWNGIGDPMLTAWWAVAAATLQQPIATEVLHGAYARFQGEFDLAERATLSLALWKFGGEAEANFLKDWLYGETPEIGMFAHSPATFLTEVSRCEDPPGRKLIATIIEDRRFETLDWQSLETILTIVNEWMEKPLVTAEEIRKVWHPTGQSHFHWQQAEAERQFPEETKNLRLALRDWRTKIRNSLPDWAPPTQ
jgi:hypothetical protein